MGWKRLTGRTQAALAGGAGILAVGGLVVATQVAAGEKTENQPPMLLDDAIEADAPADPTQALVIDVDVLNNDDDAETSIDVSTLEILDQPAVGSAHVADGLVRFVLPPGVGSDPVAVTFTYRVCDTGNPRACETAVASVLLGQRPASDISEDLDEFLENSENG